MDFFAIFSVPILCLKAVLTDCLHSSPLNTHFVKRSRILYTRHALLTLRPAVNVNISVDILYHLRNNNICVTKKTKRGKRGGVRRIKTITSERQPKSSKY